MGGHFISFLAQARAKGITGSLHVLLRRCDVIRPQRLQHAYVLDVALRYLGCLICFRHSSRRDLYVLIQPASREDRAGDISIAINRQPLVLPALDCREHRSLILRKRHYTIRQHRTLIAANRSELPLYLHKLRRRQPQVRDFPTPSVSHRCNDGPRLTAACRAQQHNQRKHQSQCLSGWPPSERRGASGWSATLGQMVEHVK